MESEKRGMERVGDCYIGPISRIRLIGPINKRMPISKRMSQLLTDMELSSQYWGLSSCTLSRLSPPLSPCFTRWASNPLSCEGEDKR